MMTEPCRQGQRQLCLKTQVNTLHECRVSGHISSAGRCGTGPAQRSAVVQPCAAPHGAVQCSQAERSAVPCIVAHQAMSLPKTLDVYTMDAPAVRVSAANSM
jgi:hypothetical protein